MNLADTIPGLRDAIAEEGFLRDVAFLSLNESISGIDVQPFTLRHLTTLSVAGCPFVVGGNITPPDVAVFMLVVTGKNRGSGFSRWRFLRKLRLKSYRALIRGIDEYLSEALQDRMPETSNDSSIYYYSSAAALVDIFGERYGWSIETILNTPIKILFQQLNIIRKSKNPGAILFNPKSDRVRSEWLRQINEGKS